MHLRHPLSILFLVIFGTLSGQVYDPTMDAALVRVGEPWDDYSMGFGPRNLIPNGNLNYLLDPCDGTYGEGADWSYYNSRWTGIQWNSSTPSSMITPGTYWPYYMRFHCDFSDINHSHPANFLGFHGGYLMMELMRWQEQEEQRNYILVTLSEPLSPGVEYAFSMDVTMALRGTNTNPVGPDPSLRPAIDRIGAVLLNDLPDSLELNQVLEGLTPFVETPIGQPVNITDVLTVQDTVVGAGQRYLVIGVFSPLEAITFDPTPDPSFWLCKYLFDNLKLYRAHCGEANGLFSQYMVPACANDTLVVAPLFATQPLQWQVNGEDLGSGPSILVPVSRTDTTMVRMVSGTGACSDTSYQWTWSKKLDISPRDTAFFCDDPMELNPSITYQDMDANDVTVATWTQVGGPLSVAVNSWNMGVTLTDPGTYVLSTTYDDCTQADTVQVHASLPLATPTGEPFFLAELRPEHCVNMYDGSIIVHDMGYGAQASYDWFQPPMPDATDSLLGLGAGNYHVRVWDPDLRCETWTLTVDLMLDSCALIEGSITTTADHDCSTPVDDQAQMAGSVTAEPSGNLAVSDANGYYSLFVPPGTSTLMHSPTDVWTGNLCGNGIIASLPMAGATFTAEFVDTVHVPVNDLAIATSYSAAWVVGNNVDLNIVVVNQGELPTSPGLRLLLPPPYALSGSDPDLLGTSGDTLLFGLDLLQPGTSYTKVISVHVPLNTDLIGSVVTLHARVQPAPDETALGDNDHTVQFTIMGSYDPNDKHVSPCGLPGSDITPVTERKFTYIVRFQNTGNYPAARVHVTDTLHPLLDATTLQLLYSSHTVNAFVYNGVLHMDHQGIMLPDSASDPEGSQGMVVFSIRAQPSASIGDAITNTANIYFDANPPIITNTVRNQYGDIATRSPGLVGTYHVLVRPLSMGLYAYTLDNLDDQLTRLRIVDAQGREVLDLPPAQKGTFSMSHLTAGPYLIVATSATAQVAERFIHLP